MSQGLIILLGIITIFLAIGLVAYLLVSNKRQQQARVLAVIGGQSGKFIDTEAEKRDKRRAELAKKLAQKEGKSKQKNSIRDQLNRAGLYETPISKFWFYSVISGVFFTCGVQLMGQAVIVVILAGIIGFFGFPKLVLKIKTGKRQAKFLEDFADALDSMVRLLKAGMPVGEAVSMVAREYTGPVGEEMMKIYDEQKIGISLADACIKAAQRMPLTEMQMFATGISIQQQTGSSLSEILLNLSKVIRARFRLKRKVQALAAEAKASAMIIGALPILVGIGLYLIAPDYMFPLFHTLKGKYYLAGAGSWMLTGIFIMRQMINFKV